MKKLYLVLCLLFGAHVMYAQHEHSLPVYLEQATWRTMYYSQHPDSILTVNYFLFSDYNRRLLQRANQQLIRAGKVFDKAEAYRFYGIGFHLTEAEITTLRYQNELSTAISDLLLHRRVLRLHYLQQKAQYPEQYRSAYSQYVSYMQRTYTTIPEQVVLSKWSLVPSTIAAVAFPIFLYNNRHTLDNPRAPLSYEHGYWGLMLHGIGVWQYNWNTQAYYRNVGLRLLTMTGALWVFPDDVYQHYRQINDGYPEHDGTHIYRSPLHRFVYSWWLHRQRDIELWQVVVFEMELARNVLKSHDQLRFNAGHYQGPFVGLWYALATARGMSMVSLDVSVGIAARAIFGYDGQHGFRKVVLGPTIRVGSHHVPYASLEFGFFFQKYIKRDIQLFHEDQRLPGTGGLGLVVNIMK